MAPDPRPAWSGTLALNPGAVLYRGPGGEAGRHAHHAVQLVVSLDRPFALELEGGR